MQRAASLPKHETMRITRRLFSTALLPLLLSIGTARAAIITVDGNWTDWGIDPNAGDWTSSTGTRIFYENYTSTDGTGYVQPGWGGQYFDVEAMYAQVHGSSLCFAIITGFDPDGVNHMGTRYTPGDIFLDVGTGWNVGIDLQTGHLYTGATGSTAYFASSTPFEITGGTDLGATSLSIPFDTLVTVYSSGSSSSTHYLYEGCVDLSRVGGAASYAGLHWTMSCGNDVGEGRIPLPPVPEPATLGLVGLGGLLAAAARRRARRANAARAAARN